MKVMKRALACALAVLLILPSASTKAAELPANEGRENISAETEMLPAEETISEEKETEQLAGDVAEGEKESPEESKETEAEEANQEEAEAEDSEVKEDSDTQQEETVPVNTEETTAEASEDTEKEAASAEESEKADSDKPEEVLPEEAEKSEKTDEVLYNTGNHVWSVVNREAFEEEGTGDACFEEDGSYTIHIPETNPFFPYEVQFTHDGEVTNEWFMTPDDSVEIGGHTFYVSASFDGTALTQMSLEISGDTIVVYPEEKEFADDESGSVSTMSLIPLETTQLSTIDLSGYTPVELTMIEAKSVIIDNGTDISDATKIAWKRLNDDNDNYVLSGINEKIDLSYGCSYGGTVSWEMIVGDGDQLNPDNVRYIVPIKTPSMKEWLIPQIYGENDFGNRIQINGETSYWEYDMESWLQTEELGAFALTYELVQNVQVILSNQENQELVKAYLGLDLQKDSFEKSHVDRIRFLDTPCFDLGDAEAKLSEYEITDSILSDDLTNPSSGYEFSLDGHDLQGTIVAYNSDGEAIGLMPFSIGIYRSTDFINLNLYNKTEGYAQKIGNSNTAYWSDDTGNVFFGIPSEYSINGQYTLVINSTKYTSEEYPDISAVYVGKYSSIEEATKAGAKNIRDSIMQSAYDGGGYIADFSNGVWISIFAGEDENAKQRVLNLCVYTVRDPSLDSGSTIIFEGLKDSTEKEVPSYVISNLDDSYAENNYITILVGEDVDLSKQYAPVFSLAKDAVAYTEGNSSPEISGKTLHLFNNGPVQYSVSAENGVNFKNYWVQIKQAKTSNGQLYISSLEDPDAATYVENGITYSTREVMLDSYHNYIHDICLVNIGTEAIPNLSVELDSDVVALDPYWTLTGQQDLLGMGTVEKDPGGKKGELANLAKLRLKAKAGVLNGTDVTGTLTIKSQGTVLMVLTLTGTVGDPAIITTEIPEAVKYVPYGTMIQNSNKYEWIEATYKVIDGALPSGMELKPNGELYGVPKETGNFRIIVQVDFKSTREAYNFPSSSAVFNIAVKENTNANVYNESDADLGYSLEVPVGVETSPGSYDFYLDKIEDTLFVSEGLYHEFIDFWLNGEKLVKGVDYTAESGSTRITISAQTLQNKALQTGTNTIAAEFRVDGDVNKELRRTAQNFRLNIETGGNSSGSGSSGSNSSGTGSSGIDTAEGKTNAVDLAVRLVNTAGSPLSNMTVELHSTPKTALTNQNGVAAFYNVEEGTHTIYVKNMAGTVIASKVFNLNLGSVTQMNGDQLTAIAGSAVTLTIQINEGTGTLSFQNFQKGDPYRVLTARTGDETAVMPWVVTLIIACAAVGTVIILEKKKRNRAA